MDRARKTSDGDARGERDDCERGRGDDRSRFRVRGELGEASRDAGDGGVFVAKLRERARGVRD